MFFSNSNTTNYLRNVIRSNETITTYYVPGQLADERECTLAVELVAVRAARPAPIQLSEGVGTLGERLRVQGEEPRDERVVSAVPKRSSEMASPRRSSASDVTIRLSAAIDRLRGSMRSRSGARDAFCLHHDPRDVKVQLRSGIDVHEQAVVQNLFKEQATALKHFKAVPVRWRTAAPLHVVQLKLLPVDN